VLVLTAALSLAPTAVRMPMAGSTLVRASASTLALVAQRAMSSRPGAMRLTATSGAM
jgi:hypothetical protein